MRRIGIHDKVTESESQVVKGAMVEEDTLPGDTEPVTEELKAPYTSSSRSHALVGSLPGDYPPSL